MNDRVQVAKTDMFPVKLVRHYVPKQYRDADKDGNPTGYEIVGHHREARRTKDLSGKVLELEAARFVDGEMAPPPVPGATGFPHKIWKDTVVRLPLDEAKSVIAAGIGERADALPN